MSPRPAGSWSLWVAAAVCAAAAFWTSNGVAPWDRDPSNVWHQYEYLAEGFARGHTYLSVDPPAALLALKDPYDPRENAPYRLWDASLYHGKYYLYHGPAPAVVLMLPWRLATGRALPQRLAVGAFAAAGIAALALLLGEIRRRHFPDLAPASLAAILIVAFHASWLPVALRRSSLWELPIVAAVAFLWWSLFFLWKFHDSGGKARWAAAACAALACMVGSRIIFLPAAAVGALLLLAAGPAPHRGRWRAAMPGFGVFAAGGLALLAYNHARFGRWTEFGMSYLLFGEEYRGIRYLNPAFVPFNAWTYLLSIPSFSPYFPFLHPFWTDAGPRGFVGFEEVYGLLFMVPVHLAGLGGAAWIFRRRAGVGSAALTATLAAALAASVLAAAFLFCWAWACSRYEVELLSGWLVLTCVGMMAVFGSPPGRRPGRAVRLAVGAAAGWSVACVWLASADFRGFMKETNPRLYAAAAHVLDYPGDMAARAQGIRFGPLELTVRVPPDAPPAESTLVASGRPQSANRLLIDNLGAGRVRLRFAENEHTVLQTPDLALSQGELRVTIAAPWLYPPGESPYWNAYDDPAVRARLQTLFAVDSDEGAFREHSDRSADATAFEPVVQASPASREPYVERVDPGSIR